MELEKMKRSTIRRLKQIKTEQGLSISKIMELMEARGQFVSEATLKKVFAEGSEDKNFRYQDSIAPIADVLLDIYGDTSESDDVETLRHFLREKNKLIEFLMIKLEEQELATAKREAIYAERKKAFEHTIETLEAQISHFREQLSRKEEAIERKDAILERLINSHLRCDS